MTGAPCTQPRADYVAGLCKRTQQTTQQHTGRDTAAEEEK